MANRFWGENEISLAISPVYQDLGCFSSFETNGVLFGKRARESKTDVINESGEMSDKK